MSRPDAAWPPQTPEPSERLPDYDPVAVGRVARRVEILSVDLLEAHFDRRDDSVLPAPTVEGRPEITIAAEWDISADDGLLGCVFTFATELADAPYQIVARFRLLYRLSGGGPPKSEDIEQFAYWNSVFNAWPYWREYVSSTINRAHLPPFIVPVMMVPMPDTQLKP